MTETTTDATGVPHDRDDRDTDELIRAYKAGDQSALEKIYSRYFGPVYGYAHAVLRDEHEAENVAQHVFMSVIEALPDYEVRPDQPFRWWLMRVTRNAALDARRRSGRSLPTDPSRLEDDDGPTADPDEVLSVLTWLKDSDLDFFVDRLPQAQGEVLILRYLLGWEFPDVAQVLGKSEGSVYRTHSRALRTLEQQLTTVGRRSARRGQRMPTLTRIKPAPVLAARRFALAGAPCDWRRTHPRLAGSKYE